MRLVLASASPRRAELLSAAGIPFTVQPVDVDESPGDTESPEAYVRRIALAKAEAAGLPDRDTVILTADTTVAIDGLILGKPRDDREAAAMLVRLSGRTHRVLTAIVLSYRASSPRAPLAPPISPAAAASSATSVARIEDLAVTNVTFHPLSEEAIASFVASGEAHGKAGAYGIQARASRFVARLDGSYTNVVGLPVDLVCRHLERIAPDLLAGTAAAAVQVED